MGIVLVSPTGGTPLPVPEIAVPQYLGRSYTVTARILASINGSRFVKPVPLVEGSGEVAVKSGTGVGRSLAVVVRADVDDAVVDPFTVEWRVEYGIRLVSGETLWMPVGVFVLTDVEAEGPGRVKVTAFDRWVRVVDARFERPRVTQGNTPAAIASLLTDVDPRIVVDVSQAPQGSHRSSLWERDRDKAVQSLARSIGAQVRFDAEGVARVTPVPSLDDPVFATINRGRGGTKIAHRAGVSSRRTYNAVVVVGETPGGDPVYGVARDTSNARTRYGGPAAKRPRFYVTSLIETTAQANAAAAGLLAQALGVARSLAVDAVPNPLMDAGHVIDVETHPSVWERHIVEAFPLPLFGAGVTIDTRSSVTEDDGE